MEWFDKALYLGTAMDWEPPRVVADWEVDCEAEDHSHATPLVHARALSQYRAQFLRIEPRASTTEQLTRMRVASLERQVSRLIDEVTRLRSALDLDGEPTDAVDPALKWVADNQRALQEHARKYVAFTPTEGVITAAASLKEVYAKLGDRVRNVSIHFVAEPLAHTDE